MPLVGCSQNIVDYQIVSKYSQTIFISSVTGQGITELKDLIWAEINKESNKLVEISHRPMYITTVETVEEDELIEDEFYDDEDEDEDISKYKGIGWDEL